MSKAYSPPSLAAGLIAAPLPALAQTATATQSPHRRRSQPRRRSRRRRANSPRASGMKKCAAEWKEAKAAGKIEKGMTWPKYWSACNKRLKTAG